MIKSAFANRSTSARIAGLALSLPLLAAVACHTPPAVAAVPPNAACNQLLPPPASASNEPVTNPVVSFDSAWTIIARTHWDTTYNGVNWNAVRDTLRPKAAAARTTGELRTILSAMIGTLRQSHFSIIPANISDGDAPTGSTRDHSGGIGATFRDVDGALMLTAVTHGGSADRAGLRAGFIVEGVDGCAVAPRLARIAKSPDMRRTRFDAWAVGNNMLSGPAGDTARVSARDGSGHVSTYAVLLETEPGLITKFGNLPPMSAHLAFEKRQIAGETVGLIRFNIWMPVLSDAFNAAIDSLRDADAIVLDIRGNFGGLGAMSTGIAGHFIDSSLTLGTMIERGNVQKYIINPQRLDRQMRRVRPFAGPVALVVDELSVSTTEIFAAALQELGRARVFGVQTAGQALPSVAERLPDGDILYHAVANFLSPNGHPIEGDGVKPDVAVPLTRAALLRGNDPALDAALAWSAKTARHDTRASKPGQQ